MVQKILTTLAPPPPPPPFDLRSSLEVAWMFFGAHSTTFRIIISRYFFGHLSSCKFIFVQYHLPLFLLLFIRLSLLLHISSSQVVQGIQL